MRRLGVRAANRSPISVFQLTATESSDMTCRGAQDGFKMKQRNIRRAIIGTKLNPWGLGQRRVGDEGARVLLAARVE